MKFEEIKTLEQLRNFLSVKGKRHRDYRQYTNLDGVYGMIDSGYLWLSRGDQMNDRQELFKGDPFEWRKIYIASLAFGTSENMAMWAIYGLLHDEAAYISFPNIAFCQWISEVTEIYDPNNGYEKINMEFELELTDVAYIDGKRLQKDAILQWNSEKIQLSNDSLEDNFEMISSEPLLTGYIKNYAWVYENEVRLRIKFKYPTDYKRIAIKFPDDFFVPGPKNEKVGIISGPWKDKNKHSVFMEKLEQNKNYFRIKNKLDFRESEFDQLVNLKKPCEYCFFGNGKKVHKRKSPSIFENCPTTSYRPNPN